MLHSKKLITLADSQLSSLNIIRKGISNENCPRWRLVLKHESNNLIIAALEDPMVDQLTTGIPHLILSPRSTLLSLANVT
jgi:hypothetical protein